MSCCFFYVPIEQCTNLINKKLIANKGALVYKQQRLFGEEDLVSGGGELN